MVSDYIQPLDLKYIFINVLSGNHLVFTGIFLIALSIIAGLFKMPNSIFLIMLALSSIFLYNWFGGGIYLLVMLIGGMITFWGISKIIKD